MFVQESSVSLFRHIGSVKVLHDVVGILSQGPGVIVGLVVSSLGSVREKRSSLGFTRGADGDLLSSTIQAVGQHHGALSPYLPSV